MSILDLEMITLEGPPPLTISEHTILPMCIQSLEHHSSLSGNVQSKLSNYRYFLGSTIFIQEFTGCKKFVFLCKKLKV